MSHFTESIVEQAALAWLESLGYTILSGPEIAPGELGKLLRDALLPRVIAGELLVSDAECIIGRCM